jgi:hypothetical protein
MSSAHATTPTLLCLATYISVVFVSMAVAMGVTLKGQTIEPAVKKDRVAAAVTGAVLAFLAALAYGIMRQHMLAYPSYWAILLILFFGMWYAVYMVFPKSLPQAPVPKTREVQNNSAIAHGVALGAALVTFGVCLKVYPMHGW